MELEQMRFLLAHVGPGKVSPVSVFEKLATEHGWTLDEFNDACFKLWQKHELDVLWGQYVATEEDKLFQHRIGYNKGLLRPTER
jgi:hypothetical protein